MTFSLVSHPLEKSLSVTYRNVITTAWSRNLLKTHWVKYLDGSETPTVCDGLFSGPRVPFVDLTVDEGPVCFRSRDRTPPPTDVSESFESCTTQTVSSFSVTRVVKYLSVGLHTSVPSKPGTLGSTRPTPFVRPFVPSRSPTGLFDVPWGGSGAWISYT